MGKLIVIEGSDGSGKATQTKLLYEYLKDQRKLVKMVSYPNYESLSSSLVKMYLGGSFGTNPYDVNAFVASSFFAVDRFASYLGEWKQFYESSEEAIVICDRYVTSNMLHQTSKLTSREEKEEFLEWDYDFEFKKGGLPVPDAVFFLDVDPETTFLLMKDRENKITHEAAKDIHEANPHFLIQSYENSMFVGEKYHWTKIKCCQCPGKMRGIEEIHEEIREKLNKILFTDKVI